MSEHQELWEVGSLWRIGEAGHVLESRPNSFTGTGGAGVAVRPVMHKAGVGICKRSCFSGIRRWTGLERGAKLSRRAAKLCDARETAGPVGWVEKRDEAEHGHETWRCNE